MFPHEHSSFSGSDPGSVRVPRPGLHPHQLSICALLQFLFSEETRDSFWKERGDDIFGFGWQAHQVRKIICSIPRF